MDLATAERISFPAPSTNGKPKGKPKAKAAPRKRKVERQRDARLHRLSVCTVGGLVAGSAALNGYWCAHEGASTAAGWILGAAIPVVVLCLAKIAAIHHRKGHRRLAAAGAAIGVGLLLLSVWHCASSIAYFTGSSILWALPFAIAIDAGMVFAEVSAIGEE